MRHRKSNRRLGRQSSHREATLRSLANALLVKESIKTTKIKAKEAQPFIENLITRAKNNSPEAKRHVFSLMRDKRLINLLFDEIAPRFKSRNSGYTRIIPLYPRRGDGSPMAILELVEKKPVAAVKKPPSLAKALESKKNKDQRETVTEEPKKDAKAAVQTMSGIKEEAQKEKAKREEKKIKKGGLFKNLRRYFRGKTP